MAIVWIETVPSPSSAASSGDDELRAFMVAVASGLSPGYIWPGSGGGSGASAGLSQLGNARLATAGNSAVTGGHGDGYLLLNRNHESLHHIGSTWTAMLGHSSMIEHAPGIGFLSASQVSSRWLTQSGSFAIPSSPAFGTVSTAFPTSYGSTAPPFVHITPIFDLINNGPTSYMMLQVSSVTTGGFSAVFSGLSASLLTTTVYWESDGTVLL